MAKTLTVRAKRLRREIDRLGLSSEQAVELLCVHERTLRRWKSEERSIPDMVFRVLELYDRVQNTP